MLCGEEGLSAVTKFRDGRTTHTMFNLIYPERRVVTAETVIQWAKDYLATEYMRRNPHAPEAAIEENARVASGEEAVQILEDAGIITVRP